MALGFVVGVLGFLGIQGFFSFELVVPHIAVLIGGLIIVCTGFYDDTRELSFKLKFVIQVILAYVLVLAGYRFEVAGLPLVDADPVNQALIAAPLTILWVVGIINAVNLLDGLDGLAAGVSIIAFACLSLVFGFQGEVGFMILTLLMVGALAGFLIYNFNPASIFMGDSGSLFIGYMVAVLTLSDKAHADPVLAILVPIMAFGLPVLDTTLCIVRRLIAGQSPFAPDSDHIHHRLVRIWSPRQAVLVLYAAALWFGTAALLMQAVGSPYAYLVLAVTFLAAYIGVRTLGYLKVGRRKALDRGQLAPAVKNGKANSAGWNSRTSTQEKEQRRRKSIVAEDDGDHVIERSDLLEMEA